MDLALRDLGEYVQAALREAVLSVDTGRDELCILVKTPALPRVLRYLRDDVNCQFKQLMDVCGVDYPGRAERFENKHPTEHPNRIQVRRIEILEPYHVQTSTGRG